MFTKYDIGQILRSGVFTSEIKNYENNCFPMMSLIEALSLQPVEPLYDHLYKPLYITSQLFCFGTQCFQNIFFFKLIDISQSMYLPSF